jgi:hypothetical protein
MDAQQKRNIVIVGTSIEVPRTLPAAQKQKQKQVMLMQP